MRGQQYWWYNNDAQAWYPPNVLPIGVNSDDLTEPSFRNVTNIFLATGMSLSAVITQNNTRPTFYPQKASDPDSVQTAANASKFTEQFERNNDWACRMDECGYYMCTDGYFAANVRYVSDGEQFGHDERDILSPIEIPIGDATVTCPCGFEAVGTSDETPTCPECGEFTQDNPAPTVTGVQNLGTVQIPRGQEVVTMVPGLQLRRTAYADEQKDYLYMDWVTDIDKAVVIGTYPERENELDTNGITGDEGSGTAASYERIARRLLYLGTGRHSGVTLEGLGTFQRAWLRPKSFYRIKDKEKRAQLLALFPKGIKIVFYNGQYCESKPESMDTAWESFHTMPGEGQLRETLISPLLPIQDQLNDCTNLLFEICMNGVPEGFADTELLDFEARNEQTATAGNITPVTLEANETIGQKMLFTQAVEPSQGMVRYIEMLLNEIPQFLSGNYPALFGGNTGSNDTAAGIAIQRNQAMGRIGRVWRNFQVFLANVSAKAVNLFGENRTEDMEIPRAGISDGTYESDYIRLSDMQGNVLAYPETDAQFPVLEADVRATLMSMWNSANPLFLAVAQQPSNLEYLFRMMGVSDLEVPGEQQRKKTNLDIKQLIATQPVPGKPQVGPDGKAMPAQPVPSVEPNQNVDDLKTASDAAKAWLISDKGLAVRETNPLGYANVELYQKTCEQLMKAQALQQAIAAQGMAGQGPGADLAGAEAMQPPPHQMPPKPAPKNQGEGNATASESNS